MQYWQFGQAPTLSLALSLPSDKGYSSSIIKIILKCGPRWFRMELNLSRNYNILRYGCKANQISCCQQRHSRSSVNCLQFFSASWCYFEVRQFWIFYWTWGWIINLYAFLCTDMELPIKKTSNIFWITLLVTAFIFHSNPMRWKSQKKAKQQHRNEQQGKRHRLRTCIRIWETKIG